MDTVRLALPDGHAKDVVSKGSTSTIEPEAPRPAAPLPASAVGAAVLAPPSSPTVPPSASSVGRPARWDSHVRR
jgi:hypothetical protein